MSLLLLLTAEAYSAEPENKSINGSVDTQSQPAMQQAADTEKKPRLGGYKILPVPTIITEPAIGKGLGLAIALLHPVKRGSGSLPSTASATAMADMQSDRQAPPVVTAIFGAYTSNGTQVAGIGHSNNWREDHIRYAGALATSKIHAKFYLLGLPFKFTLDGDFIYQNIKFRVKDSAIFLGMSFSYLDATNSFKTDFPANQSANFTFDSDLEDTGLSLEGSYDSRDNTVNPETGEFINLTLWRFDQDFGGDYDYWSTKLKALSFRKLGKKFTLGLRLEIDSVDGKPPFFKYPWVKLRGIPAMRYQNKTAGAVEVEGRYRLAPKWELVGFAGKGFTRGEVKAFDTPNNIHNFGAGVRYKLLEEHNVWVGMDIAKGPEEWNWYIQIGHPW